MKKAKKRFLMTGVIALFLLLIVGAGSSLAYFTAYDLKENCFRIGYNTTEIIEDFPDPEPTPIEDNPEWKKTVTVSSPASDTGTNVDCYVRVRISFSDSAIGNAVRLKGFHSESWIPGPEGYYYCPLILKQGETLPPVFESAAIDSSALNASEIERISEFRVNIYEESVQAPKSGDFRDAWKQFGIDMGETGT